MADDFSFEVKYQGPISDDQAEAMGAKIIEALKAENGKEKLDPNWDVGFVNGTFVRGGGLTDE